MAGGFGTRLQQVVSDVPKPMAPVNQRPFLDYQLKRLALAGFKHVILSTGHLAESIENYYAKGFSGLALSFSREHTALGTGGGIRLAMNYCNESNCLVLNGDSLFDFSLQDFMQKSSSANALHSLALREVEDCSRYGQVKIDERQRITFFGEKSEHAQAGLINAGVYFLNKKHFIEHTKADTNFSIERNFFEPLAGSGNLCGFSFSGYFIDIGIPEDYLRAQDDFKRFEHYF